MKIAIYSDTFPPQINGVSKIVYDSAVELVKLGHEVCVFTISSGIKDKHQDELFKKLGFNIVRIPSIPIYVYPGFRLALPLGFSNRKLKKFNPDIIHTHTPFSVGWELVLPSKLLHIPVVGTYHTFFNFYLKHAYLDYKWVNKWSWDYTLDYYNNCNIILCPSKSLADELKSHKLKKPVQILPNGINTNLFIPVPSILKKQELKKKWKIERKSLVYMGRLSYEKSVDLIIKAMAEMVKQVPTLKLLILGDGPERKKLEKLVSELNLKKNIIFLGFVYDKKLVEALQVNDIFLTASKTENMPLSVMEAMAVGLPVIAVDALGVPELVKNNVNGYLVQPDNCSQIVKKTLELLRDDEKIKTFGKASRKKAVDYSLENMAKSFEKIYKEIIKKK